MLAVKPGSFDLPSPRLFFRGFALWERGEILFFLAARSAAGYKKGKNSN
jgi:hypothetical protein